MRARRSFGEMLFDIGNVGFLLLLMFSALYPFLYVALASVSDPAEMGKHQGLLLSPIGFHLDAYKAVLNNKMILTGFRNTLFYVLIGTTLNVVFTAMLAYALSRKDLFLKNAIMYYVVFTMFFGGGLIPTYLMVKQLGLLNTGAAVILPGLISAMNMIIMRTYFQSLPDSLEESAKIDGANEFVILFKIVIPLSMPIIAVMLLYYGVGHWNSWFNASIYLTKPKLFPLQLVLRDILINSKTEDMMVSLGTKNGQDMSEMIKYAAIMVATIPVLLAYPFLQKYFVKGVMIGAIKG
ncbi:carbohydrate ABC transporter permease [Paenibacillus sp. MBLB4367]|uniref:carbohydrate ABC transporter permease n=1 Tax=Paenibacillus sp. MBLB4367 TaxID=3384767 RepID=UPI0039081E3C